MGTHPTTPDCEDEARESSSPLSPTSMAHRVIITPDRLLERRLRLPFGIMTDQNLLLDLPAELRNMVWRYIALEKPEVSIFADHFEANFANISEQTRAEVMDIYFKEGTFNLGYHRAGSIEHIQDLSEKVEEIEVPLSSINNFTALLEYRILIPIMNASGNIWGYRVSVCFFQLELRRHAPKGHQLSLRAIPHARSQGMMNKATESCVCPLIPMVEAMDEAAVDWVQVMFQVMCVIPSAMRVPGNVCEGCGKRRLCHFGHKKVRESVERWTSFAGFFARMKEMRAMIWNGHEGGDAEAFCQGARFGGYFF